MIDGRQSARAGILTTGDADRDRCARVDHDVQFRGGLHAAIDASSPTQLDEIGPHIAHDTPRDVSAAGRHQARSVIASTPRTSTRAIATELAVWSRSST